MSRHRPEGRFAPYSPLFTGAVPVDRNWAEVESLSEAEVMMSATYRHQSIKVTVHFERREDGGLTVWSEDLPGLTLSHRDPALVLDDVKAAIESLITDMLGERVRVEPLVELREVLHPETADKADIPSGIREYVSRIAA